MYRVHPYFEGFSFFGFVHRGGNEKETENTLEAFQYSSDLGFIFMETDVQTSKDGKIVIFHDDNLERMAGFQSQIKDLSFQEIKKIELRDGGRIPLLSDALSSFPNLRFNIDIKTEDAVEETVRLIKSHKSLNRVCLASFSSSRLKKIRKIAGGDLCTSSGQMDIVKLIINSLGLNLEIPEGECAQVPISQWGIPIVTKKFIQNTHKLNKFVHVWTIDDEPEMERLFHLGVDGLMTDKPSVLKRFMEKKGLFNS